MKVFSNITLGFCLIYYYGFLQYLPGSYFPLLGNISRKFRAAILRIFFPQNYGKHVNIGRKVYLGKFKCLKIGKNSGLGDFFEIRAANVEIGNNFMSGEHVLILGSTHKHDRIDIPIGEQGDLPKPNLKIEDDVWIGRGVTIIPKNYSIGKGAIIGACAVVAKEIPPYAIAVGNPAKIIGYRK